MLLLRWAALIALLWFAVNGPFVGLIIAGTVCLVFLAKDAIRQPDLIKTLWPGVLGAVLGLVLCWVVGFLLVKIVGSDKTVYVGPGFDRWNLPGTILGGAVWIAATVWSIQRWKRRLNL